MHYSLACVKCASCAKVCPVDKIKVTEESGERTIWKKTFTLVECKVCGKQFATMMELWRAAHKLGAEVPELCEECRKKAITDVMAATYGR